MIIQSVIQTYVYNQTMGAVTEPVNGNWLQAYCEYLGVTEPVNASWLQALCIYFGITAPLYGSWTIALADYYGITQPENGTWWYAISQVSGAPPVVSFIWNLNTTNWESETRIWDTVTTAPTAEFTSDITTVVAGDQVQYQDISTGQPSSWSWTFAGGTPATSTAQNPLITYNTVGQYDTSLEASNIIGSDTNNKLNYIDTIASAQTITFQMNTGWSLGWVYSWIEVQEETSPGVWTSIEYDGNPYWCTDAACTNPVPAGYYKINNGPYGATPGIYGMNFYQNDPQGMSNVDREIILNPGDYRIIGKTITSGANYGQYVSYTVLNGATTVLPSYLGDQLTFSQIGVVQQTFTI